MGLSLNIWKRQQFCHTFSPRRANMRSQRFVVMLLLSLLLAAQYIHAAPSFRPNNTGLSRKSLIQHSRLTIRGGSTKKPSSRQRVRTTNKDSPTKKQKQPIKTETESKSVSISSQQDLPVVEALLIPKSLGWTRLIQYASAFAMMISFLACIKTAGQPYAAAVYSTIHGTTSKSYSKCQR